MTTLYNETSDVDHANHPTLSLALGGGVIFGRLANTADAIFGISTDFDFYQFRLGTGSGQIAPGSLLTITFVPGPNWDSVTGEAQVSFRIDSDTSLHSTLYYLGPNGNVIRHHPALQDVQPGPLTVTFQVPTDIPDPNHIIDGDIHLPNDGSFGIEFQVFGYADNTFSPLDYQLTISGPTTPQPDLTLSDVAAIPNTAVAGGQVLVLYTLNNGGLGNATSPSHAIYLSTNATLDGSDILLDTRAHPSIGPETPASTSSEVTLPGNLTPGTYYLLVVVDPDNTITEDDETNNIAVVPINVGGASVQYNEHSYAFVNFNGSSQSWSQARDGAAAMGGYLATVGSQSENDFILNTVLAGHLPGFSAAFIGASDAGHEGVWQWVTGPDAGTTFWNGGVNGSPASGRYANWSPADPNNVTSNAEGSENFAVMGASGKWVDVPSVRSAGATVGYVVEFSGTGHTTVQQEILALYIALYNRAAEGPGYAYWVDQVAHQADGAGITVGNSSRVTVSLTDATALGQAFVLTQSTYFNATYGAMNDTQFISALYVNIAGNGGDPGGIQYWSNLLHNAQALGQSAQNARAGLVGQMVHDMVAFNIDIRPAGLTDVQWADTILRQNTINNKIAVSLAYETASEAPGGTILVPQSFTDSAFRAAVRVVQHVNSDHASADAAITGILHALSGQNAAFIL